MDKRKFNRVPEDTSQQESFVKNVIGKLNNCATKEDLNKPLEDRGTLDLRDNTKFDIVEDQETFDAYLKVNLENGIYHLDTSSLYDSAEQSKCINFGKYNGDKLNYKYLQIIKPLREGAPIAFGSDFSNALASQGYVTLGQFNEFAYAIIIINGIVIFTVDDEV